LLRWLLADFGVALSSTPVHCDSTGAINIAQDSVNHELIKHVGVDSFYIRSVVQGNIIALQYVPSEIQLEDLPRPILELSIVFFFPNSI
jgi:hypothetical protein